MYSFTVRAHVVDIPARRIFPGEVVVQDGRIASITPVEGDVLGYVLPGFVDAHVHVESSMLIPSEFARLAVTHGTVATVSDPHEIANVLGVQGVEYMIANGKQVPFHFCFGAPSCVPATTFETAGANIDAAAVGALLERPDIGYLSEMMNFPGVLNSDPEVMAKVSHAHRLGKPVDGHAPGLRGDTARRYIEAGISTDHECFTREEALDKLADDVHLYFGLGCRNVTKVYVPEGYDFIPLLRAFDRYNYLADYHKYKNNYDYNLAILILNKKPYMSNASLLLVEEASPFSPIGQLHYERYPEAGNLLVRLRESDAIQCVVGAGGVPFGSAQHPALSDYADGIDTLQFLSSL